MMKTKKHCFTCNKKTDRRSQTMTNYECLKCYEAKRIKTKQKIKKLQEKINK